MVQLFSMETDTTDGLTSPSQLSSLPMHMYAVDYVVPQLASFPGSLPPHDDDERFVVVMQGESLGSRLYHSSHKPKGPERPVSA